MAVPLASAPWGDGQKCFQTFPNAPQGGGKVTLARITDLGEHRNYTTEVLRFTKAHQLLYKLGEEGDVQSAQVLVTQGNGREKEELVCESSRLFDDSVPIGPNPLGLPLGAPRVRGSAALETRAP